MMLLLSPLFFFSHILYFLCVGGLQKEIALLQRAEECGPYNSDFPFFFDDHIIYLFLVGGLQEDIAAL